jgi:hypothetical protein
MTSFDEARAAWRAAIFMQVIGLIGLSLDGTFWLTTHHRVLPPYLVAQGVMAVLLLVLFLDRRHPHKSLGAFADLACIAFVLVALWSADDILAREPRAWIPFQSHKLSVLTIALVAPTPPWVGVVCISAVTLAALAQFWALGPEVRAHLAVGEPWGTLAFGVFALGIFLHRVRLLRLEHEAMRAQAEAESLRRLARVALAVRDLSNTPLQTLRLSTELLRRHHAENVTRLDQMDRALARLEELERVLVQYEARTQWRPGDESFDALAILERPEGGAETPEAVSRPRSRARGGHRA